MLGDKRVSDWRTCFMNSRPSLTSPHARGWHLGVNLQEGVAAARTTCSRSGKGQKKENREAHLAFVLISCWKHHFALSLFVVWSCCLFIMFLVIDTHATRCRMENEKIVKECSSSRSSTRFVDGFMHATTACDYLQVTDWAGLGCEQRLGDVKWLDVGGDSISIQVRKKRWPPVDNLPEPKLGHPLSLSHHGPT